MKIEWPTVAVLALGTAAIGGCIYAKVDPEYVGALAVVVFGALAKMKQAWTTPPKDGDK